jgi:hypothetical protein
MRAIFTTLERKRKRVPGTLMRSLRAAINEAEAESAVDDLQGLFKHHDGWWRQYVRASVGSGPPVSLAQEEQMYRQAEGYKLRIAKAVNAIGNKAADRKVKSMLMWLGRGERSKAQSAYWMMRSVLEKAGVL